jgi:beta-lactamase family protein
MALTEPEAGQANGASAPIDELDMKLKVAEVLDYWPSAGLAVVVVRDGSLEWFLGHGVADVESKEPITEDTVFRCPLQQVAERVGAERGSVTDIYLPRWFAHNLPAIHVPLILLAGYLHGRNLRHR